MARPRIHILALGGTIATRPDASGAMQMGLGADDLVAAVPLLAKVAEIQAETVSRVGSHSLGFDQIHALAAQIRLLNVDGVVVTQGTDTLEETAYWLDLTTNSEKPIILIGAQRNASEPDFDGPRNLLNAVRICVDPQSKGKGAMLAMNNQINAARDVTKTHTSSVETFKSGDFGVLGIVDYDRVVFSRAPLQRQYVPIKSDVMPYVEIVAMYGGADGHLIRAAVDHGAKGIVIQGLGWGNVNLPMFAAIKEEIAKGVPVVIASRVPNGRVLPNHGWEGGGKTLEDAGAVMGNDLSPQKARILLMLLLQNATKGQKELQAAFNGP